jgi:hypothetical protein
MKSKNIKKMKIIFNKYEKNVTFTCEAKETISSLGIPYNSLRLSTSGWKRKYHIVWAHDDIKAIYHSIGAISTHVCQILH